MKYFFSLILIFLNLAVANGSILNSSIYENLIIKGFSKSSKKIHVSMNYIENAIIIAKVKGPKKNYNLFNQSSNFNSQENKILKKIYNHESFYQIYTSNVSFYNINQINLITYKLSLEHFLNSKANIDSHNVFLNYMINSNFYGKMPNYINEKQNKLCFPIEITYNSSNGIYSIEIFAFDNELNLIADEKLHFIVKDNYPYNFIKIFSKSNPFGYTCLTIIIAISLGFTATRLKYKQTQ